MYQSTQLMLARELLPIGKKEKMLINTFALAMNHEHAVRERHNVSIKSIVWNFPKLAKRICDFSSVVCSFFFSIFLFANLNWRIFCPITLCKLRHIARERASHTCKSVYHLFIADGCFASVSNIKNAISRCSKRSHRGSSS